VPSSSFDMFFACTILVAAALIATAFLSSTMKARIDGTQDINKDSYLKAVADRILTNPGVPNNWGTTYGLPTDFGLSASDSTNSYQIDADKITRLSSQTNGSLSYIDLLNAAKLTNIALGITVSPIMTVEAFQVDNSTTGSNTSFDFQVSTSIDSKPTRATLHCYILADSYYSTANGTIQANGMGSITFQIPNTKINTTNLIIFAEATFDARVLSYTVYNLTDSSPESISNNNIFLLNTVNHQIDLANNTTALSNLGGYLFSYSTMQSLNFAQGQNYWAIPSSTVNSPIILVIFSVSDGLYIQQWSAYPQVPLKAGADFEGQEQNVFSYIVTINGVLYRLDISLGDLP
jgi:hypothetical protein